MGRKGIKIYCKSCNSEGIHQAKGLCRNCYFKQWRVKNLGKRRAYEKEYGPKHYQKYKDKYAKQSYEWRIANPDKVKEKNIKYANKYPERIKAMKYADRHNQRSDICELCGINENLHFHHTDYINNIGYTVCAKCHKVKV